MINFKECLPLVMFSKISLSIVSNVFAVLDTFPGVSPTGLTSFGSFAVSYLFDSIAIISSTILPEVKLSLPDI